jgi:hypothetical protein
LPVYHVGVDQLAQGASLGNARIWLESKADEGMLNCWSIEAGQQVMGGTAITYLAPASEVSPVGWPATEATGQRHSELLRTFPSTHGRLHLHPAYQQHDLTLYWHCVADPRNFNTVPASSASGRTARRWPTTVCVSHRGTRRASSGRPSMAPSGSSSKASISRFSRRGYALYSFRQARGCDGRV